MSSTIINIGGAAEPFYMLGLDGDILFALEQEGIRIKGYIAKRPSSVSMNYIGDDFEALSVIGRSSNLINSIDQPTTRKSLAKLYEDHNFLAFVSSNANISRSATYGKATIVQQETFISDMVKIGDFVKINVGVHIHHDCTIDSYVTIAPNAALMGGVRVHSMSYIGAGAQIRQNVKIGKNCMIGMGSIVVEDIPDNSIAYGVPCKVIKEQTVNY